MSIFDVKRIILWEGTILTVIGYNYSANTLIARNEAKKEIHIFNCEWLEKLHAEGKIELEV